MFKTYFQHQYTLSLQKQTEMPAELDIQSKYKKLSESYHQLLIKQNDEQQFIKVIKILIFVLSLITDIKSQFCSIFKMFKF